MTYQESPERMYILPYLFCRALWAYHAGMRKRHPDTLIPPGTKARTRKFSKAKPASETHQSIDQQVEAFLKSGNKIQKISRGVSGQPKVQGGRRHIHIGSKHRTT